MVHSFIISLKGDVRQVNREYFTRISFNFKDLKDYTKISHNYNPKFHKNHDKISHNPKYHAKIKCLLFLFFLYKFKFKLNIHIHNVVKFYLNQLIHLLV